MNSQVLLGTVLDFLYIEMISKDYVRSKYDIFRHSFLFNEVTVVNCDFNSVVGGSYKVGYIALLY